MINFSAATNFDPDLLERIAELNDKYKDRARIVEVYGSAPEIFSTNNLFLGSCRVKGQLPDVSEDKLKEYVRKAHELGIKFNYTLNAKILDALNHDQNFHHQIFAFFTELNFNIGIDGITISDDYFMQFQPTFRNLAFVISLVKGLNSPSDVHRYFEKGATLVMLNQHTANRSQMLHEFSSMKNSGLLKNKFVALYANISCLDHCPMRDAHYDFLSRASFLPQPYSYSAVDPFMLWCSDIYLKNPVELLKSPFIRPEDTAYYERFGITHFKLSDRREPTDALVELYEAYMSGEFRGNLFDLMFRYGRKWTNAVHGCSHAHIDVPQIYIDNDKLTEMKFIENVMSLKGKELDDFYAEATKRAVRIEMN